MPRPDDLLTAYFRSGAIWCSQPSDCPIVARLEPALTLSAAADQIQRLHDDPSLGVRKLLVFANSRAPVEALAGLLRPRPRLDGKVTAHHGSLARGERLRVEGQFKDARSGVCVATMTLEIGIDIGNVDRVVLLAPPPNVSALVQRVGRANRRQKTTHVLGLYQSGFERSRFEHLLECATAGRMFDSPVAFRPDVIAQQLLGLLLQNPRGWVSAAAGHARLPLAVGRIWTLADCEKLLVALATEELIRPIAGGRYVADAGAIERFERGHIHSLITDNGETEIVDRTTGRTVARARFSAEDGDQLAAGADVTLALGGTRRQVSHVRDRKVFVQSAAGSAAARFISREAPRYSMDLARGLARHLGLEGTTLLLSATPKGCRMGHFMGHFMGTVEGRLLGWMLEATPDFPEMGRVGPFFMSLKEIESGRLKAQPAKRKKFQAILRYALRSWFEDECPWTEAEVGQRLEVLTDDVASIRRGFIDHAYMTRNPGGSEYRITERGRNFHESVGMRHDGASAAGAPNPCELGRGFRVGHIPEYYSSVFLRDRRNASVECRISYRAGVASRERGDGGKVCGR
ncbi:MAG: hypothetical protein ACI9OJ_000984 [Myxococcota bacterium]